MVRVDVVHLAEGPGWRVVGGFRAATGLLADTPLLAVLDLAPAAEVRFRTAELLLDAHVLPVLEVLPDRVASILVGERRWDFARSFDVLTWRALALGCAELAAGRTHWQSTAQPNSPASSRPAIAAVRAAAVTSAAEPASPSPGTGA